MLIHSISTEREDFALSATVDIKADRETSTGIAFKAKPRKPRYRGLRHIRGRDRTTHESELKVYRFLTKPYALQRVEVSILGLSSAIARGVIGPLGFGLLRIFYSEIFCWPITDTPGASYLFVPPITETLPIKHSR